MDRTRVETRPDRPHHADYHASEAAYLAALNARWDARRADIVTTALKAANRGVAP